MIAEKGRDRRPGAQWPDLQNPRKRQKIFGQPGLPPGLRRRDHQPGTRLAGDRLSALRGQADILRALADSVARRVIDTAETWPPLPAGWSADATASSPDTTDQQLRLV